MSAMHHDASPDLKVVGTVLKDVLGVMHFLFLVIHISSRRIFFLFFPCVQNIET